MNNTSNYPVFKVGDRVKITDGVWRGEIGTIESTRIVTANVCIDGDKGVALVFHRHLQHDVMVDHDTEE